MKTIDLEECELLCQLAEESSELAQAALKLRRAIDGSNPTPKTKEQCVDNLIEEIADCLTVIRKLESLPNYYMDRVELVCMEKDQRWKKRLAEREANKNGKL